ncbi:MAG: endopeptidase La [Chloroflexi bacterium]|nr:endopeptidase La [Chloroflexota bacterium]
MVNVPLTKNRGFEIPLLPRRRGVLFPNTAGPILVGRPTSLRAIEEATMRGTAVAVVTQRDPSLTDITVDDIFPVATEALINRALKLPDGTTQVWAQGQRRLRIEAITGDEPYYRARVTPIREPSRTSLSTEALKRAVLALFEKCVRLSPSLPDDAFVMALNIDRAGWLADFIASSLEVDDGDAEDILATVDPFERLRRVNIILARELDVLELQTKIHTQVQEEVDKSQREYFLREQMKAIQRELGDGDPQQREASDLREKAAASGMPEHAARKAEEEIRRLETMPAAAPETSVIRTYLDWLVTLPWGIESEDRLDLKHAAEVLDANHYGLPRVKERILEFMAVRRLRGARSEERGAGGSGSARGPLLCFVGPPGVGKTSLGRSIAEALGRQFVRLSLGGVRDEAEIRGHRRTYVGALPGRIIHTLRQAGTVNPVFMLDEIDKVGMDFRGDPSAALLEALDPEQNHAFSDHYLDVSFDLSRVLFIATANQLAPIIPALRDRLEIIELVGYTEDEKLRIAGQFLVPRQLVENGLDGERLTFSEGALRRLVREYTREAGVRNLEREIGAICRKVARRVAEGDDAPLAVAANGLVRMLGPQKYFWGMAEERDEVGVATGVTWTEMGGDVLAVEVTLLPGKGKLLLTGQLGEVMRESAQAALSYARSRAGEFGIAPELFEYNDVHVHVPSGAVPKEGPSAGITIATALVSAMMRRPVAREVAMTGEITLRGRVLPIGGLREKVLAAHRAGITTFVLPAKNRKDLEEVPQTVRRELRFVLVDDMREVLDVALGEQVSARLAAVGAASG